MADLYRVSLCIEGESIAHSVHSWDGVCGHDRNTDLLLCLNTNYLYMELECHLGQTVYSALLPTLAVACLSLRTCGLELLVADVGIVLLLHYWCIFKVGVQLINSHHIHHLPQCVRSLLPHQHSY